VPGAHDLCHLPRRRAEVTQVVLAVRSLAGLRLRF
jgi:hypothetical protein